MNLWMFHVFGPLLDDRVRDDCGTRNPVGLGEQDAG